MLISLTEFWGIILCPKNIHNYFLVIKTNISFTEKIGREKEKERNRKKQSKERGIL